jgi:hypothetical protein
MYLLKPHSWLCMAGKAVAAFLAAFQDHVQVKEGF